MLKGFRDFVLRGNVVDLAVGVVIGRLQTAIIGENDDQNVLGGFAEVLGHLLTGRHKTR